MDKNRCYLCERLCYTDSHNYNECEYRRCRSFGVPENRMYEEACTRLAVKFGRKHDLKFEGWVGCFSPDRYTWYEGAGSWAHFGDMVASMEDMRADLMLDAPSDAYNNYLEENLTEYYTAQKERRPQRKVSYRNWLLGARRDTAASSAEWLAMQTKEAAEACRRFSEAYKNLKEEMQRNADELLDGSDGLY